MADGWVPGRPQAGCAVLPKFRPSPTQSYPTILPSRRAGEQIAEGGARSQGKGRLVIGGLCLTLRTKRLAGNADVPAPPCTSQGLDHQLARQLPIAGLN